MYCKKCGKQLDDNMRFCERCGQSVRQSKNNSSEAKRREIKELKEERLNRKKKLEEREIKKKQVKNRKNRKRTKILAISFMALLLGLIAAMVAWFVTTKNLENALWKTTDGSVAINTTPTPDVPVVPTQTAYAIAENTNTDEVNKDGYREYKSNTLVFAYPSVFIKQGVSAGMKLNAYDKEGGGAITLCERGPVSGEAKDLLAETSQTCGGEVVYSRAGDGWYVIEYSKNDIIYHRKALLSNNIEYVYEFSYSSVSTKASDYKEYIDYMDEKFKM